MKLAFGDLEADGLYYEATRVWCGVFKDKDGIHYFRPHQIEDMLKYLDTVDVLVMHNGINFDFPLLKKLYGYEIKAKKVDTLIMSRLLNPRRKSPPDCPNKIAPHSIEAWGYRVGRGKPEHEDWSKFSEEMLFRCQEDVLILESVYYELLKEARGGNWRNAFLLNFKLFENLQKQEEYGWKIDKSYMDKCIAQLEKWIRWIDIVLTPHLPLVTENLGELKKPFLKSGKYSGFVIKWAEENNVDLSRLNITGSFTRLKLRPVNLNSLIESKDFLINQGWKPSEFTEKGAPKFSKDESFEGLNSKIGKLVARRIQCRQRLSIITGLKELIRPDGRIPSVIKNLAATGRAIHQNIVNIPHVGSFYGKQMRKIFICEEGKVLVGTDSAGNQLRQLASRIKNQEYIDAIVKGRKEDKTDIHSLTQKKGGLASRDIAKNVIYCLLFGGGDEKLAKTAHIPVRQGAELRQKLYTGLAGLDELMEQLTSEWRHTATLKYNPQFNKMEKCDGYITGLDGRKILVPSEHMLLVYLLQSDEAIHMAAAYNLFHNRMGKRGYTYGKEYGVVCWYHDEFTVECDENIAEEVKKLSEDCIKDAGAFFHILCPHEGEGKIGKSWYDIH